MITGIETKFTKHAVTRSQQRGIRYWVIEFILEHADKSKHAGRGCTSQFVSRKKLNEMIKDNILEPADAALISGVVVIDRDQAIRTVFHKQIRMRM